MPQDKLIGTITIDLAEEPFCVQKKVRRKSKMYMKDGLLSADSSGDVLRKPKLTNGKPTYLKKNGKETTTPLNKDGTIREMVMIDHEAVSVVMEDETWDDGSPKMVPGRITFAPQVVSNDNKGRLRRDKKLLSGASLTKEETEALSAFLELLKQRLLK